MAAFTQNEQLMSKITVYSLISRAAIFVFQVVFNAIIPDHDAGVFNPPQENSTLSVIHNLTDTVLAGFRRWDAVYFTHIAEHGYTYENTLAFFPAYPLLMWMVTKSVLFPFQFLLAYRQVVLLAGVLVNVYLFVQSAKCIFRLGQIITKNDKIAYKAALLFCINPASVFMSAAYSEVLFAYLTFNGMLQSERGKKFSASLYFGLSCATRSNGLLNMGYLMYKLCRDLPSVFKRLKGIMMTNVGAFISTLFIFIAFRVIPWCVCIFTCVTPFALYQYYCYGLYCERSYNLDVANHIQEYGRSEGLKLVGDEPSSWCQKTVPLAYSYIQQHYWDQGFLRYWEPKQLPNFLLVVPVTLLVLYTGHQYFKHNRHTCLTLGFSETHHHTKKELPERAHYQLEGAAALPYVIHAVVLTLFGWFFIHVQVLTRLLFSACPVLLWSAAHLISQDTPVQPRYNPYTINPPPGPVVEAAENRDTTWKNLLTNQIAAYRSQDFRTKLVIGYFLGYFVIGTALFCNFLPWT